MSGLLVLPGWDDDGKSQFDLLKNELSHDGWTCRRANLPDASWPAVRRDAATRADSFAQALRDFDGLREDISSAPAAALGFSYGGYMAALLAGERNIEWLILRSPALYLDERWTAPKVDLDKAQLDEYRHHRHSPDNNLALRSCTEFKGDALLISSELDEVIPPQVIESYAEALSGARSLTRYVLRAADHELSEAVWRKQYHQQVVEWLQAMLKSSRPDTT